MTQPIDILWFSDGQISDGVPIDHFRWVGRLAADYEIPVVFNGGDHWDLRTFRKRAPEGEREGMRFKADLEHGHRAFDLFDAAVRERKGYKPRKIFLKGNHEERMEWFLEEQPHLKGVIGDHMLARQGWEMHRFLKVVKVAGIFFSHYFRIRTGRNAISGTMQNRLNKVGNSFVQGHQQVFMHERRPRHDGSVMNGVVCGAFHQHHEEYLSEQMKNHWRGAIVMWFAKNGDFCVEQWSIDRLKHVYGG